MATSAASGAPPDEVAAGDGSSCLTAGWGAPPSKLGPAGAPLLETAGAPPFLEATAPAEDSATWVL